MDSKGTGEPLRNARSFGSNPDALNQSLVIDLRIQAQEALL